MNKIQWTSQKAHYQLAYSILNLGNWLKYSQNAILRKELFETKGRLLVEATSDPYWGRGASKRDKRITPNTVFKGKNVFGHLLTRLREKMMRMPEYQNEILARENAENSNLTGESTYTTLRKLTCDASSRNSMSVEENSLESESETGRGAKRKLEVSPSEKLANTKNMNINTEENND